jgi:putative addiction module antidote
MYKIQLRKVGGSTGATFPKEMIEQMNVREGDTLFAFRRDGEFVLTPYDPDFAETMRVFDEVRREYRDAFRELAK